MKSDSYEKEVKSLKKSLSKNEIELNDANANVNSLTRKKDGLEIELKSSREAYEIENKKRVYFEEEFEKLNLLLEESSKDAELNTKVKLEKLSQELNQKWSETLRLVILNSLRLHIT